MGNGTRIAGQTTSQPNQGEEHLPFRFWILVLITGVVTGMAGGILMLLLRAVQHACYGYQSGNFLSGVEHSSPDRRLPVLLAAGVFAGAVLFFLRRVIGKGRGLTRAIWKESGTMPSLPALIDAIVSIIIVAMGVSLGREGALKEAGAVVANKVSDWWTANPSQRHVLVACGAGAGMAAAYNVPFGGAVFALEVLLGTMAMPAVLAALTTSFVATAVSWLFLPDQPTYIVSSATLSSPLLLWAVLAGPLCGVVSAAYIRAIRWAVTHKPKGWKVLWMPVVVFGILGAVSIRYPELLGNGKNLVQLAYLDQIGPGPMLVLLVLKPLATISCLRSGAPGGLFTPTMTFGALLGAVLAHLWGLVIPTGPVGAYAIIGSGAVLAAASQGPISSIVFVLELTHHADSLMVPLLIAVVGATITAKRLESHSIYSVHA